MILFDFSFILSLPPRHAPPSPAVLRAQSAVQRNLQKLLRPLQTKAARPPLNGKEKLGAEDRLCVLVDPVLGDPSECAPPVGAKGQELASALGAEGDHLAEALTYPQG